MSMAVKSDRIKCQKMSKNVFGKIVQKNPEKCFEKLEKNTGNPKKYCQKILEKGSENQQWMEWNIMEKIHSTK